MAKEEGLIGFVLFVGLFFAGFWYVSVTADTADLSVETDIDSSLTQSVDEYWLHQNNSRDYTANCRQTQDNQTLYVQPGDTCEWSSTFYNTTNSTLGTPESLDYIADARSGDLQATITTYYNDSVVETNTYELQSSIRTIDLSSDYNSTPVDEVDVQLYLDENNKNENKAPSVSSYDLEILESTRTEDVGLTNNVLPQLTLLIFMVVGIMFLARYLSD